MANIDKKFKRLVTQVFNAGNIKPSRVGDTYSVPGLSICTAPIHAEFPIITTRQIFYMGAVGELAAFLQGATMLRDFKAAGCRYWDDTALAWDRNEGRHLHNFEVGNIYGAQWRRWRGELDQLQVLVDGLLADPHGRRHILTTWDPLDLPNMCLPPCHLLAQFYVTAKHELDCIVYMRSVDIALGLPTDLTLYAILTMLVAKSVGLLPGRLHFHFGDAHIYCLHEHQLHHQVYERHGSQLSSLVSLNNTADLFAFKPEHFTMERYNYDNAIKYELFV
jgi:thymidylate synthase